MSLALGKPKTMVFTVFFASSSKNHGIYSIFCLVPSKNTGIYAVFNMLQEVVASWGQRKNTVFYDVFASLAQKKVQLANTSACC